MKLIRKNFFELPKISKLEEESNSDNSNNSDNEDEEDNNSNEDEEDNSLNLDELINSKSYEEVYKVLSSLKISGKPFDFYGFVKWLETDECQKLDDKIQNSENDLNQVSK